MGAVLGFNYEPNLLKMKRDHLIIGSQALKYHYLDFPREPKDTDIIVTANLYQKITDDVSEIDHWQEGRGDSYILRYEGYNHPFEYFITDCVASLHLILSKLCNENDLYASPEILYSLKKGHINFPVKFNKHIGDLMFLREKLRLEKDISLEDDLSSPTDLLDSYPMLTDIHFIETERRLGKLRTPNMKGEDVKKFFGKSKNYVTSYYVHDDMHKAIALMHEGDPVYQKILAEGKEVETDENLWNTLTLQQKIWCVLEEVYVIALERKIVPTFFDKEAPLVDAKEAFDWALMRVCTTLCDGFFREFAVRAYSEIQKQYNPKYVELFFKNIKQYDTNYEKSEE